MLKSLPSIFYCVLLFGAGLCHADSGTLNFSTLAGSAATLINSIDGTGSAAQFYSPRGVAVDSLGNVFVADSSNNTIRKITAAGVVTTFAGSPGVQGKLDGTGAAARFLDPYGVAVDSSGTVYVADTSNNSIRKITSAGVVTTLAGNGAQGGTNGTGPSATFREPRGLGVDPAGNVYVADYGNHVVRKITPAGVTTTFAGTMGVPGSADGAGTAALFRGLDSVAVDSAGNVYVADTDNRTIRKITSSGIVSTLAGSAGAGGSSDGTGTAARFGEPRGISVDANGTIHVADYGGHTVRRITSAGVVSTLAGSGGAPGTVDGTGAAARFYAPSAVSSDSAGNVYVADTSNNTIRKITTAGVVTTFAGLAGRSSSVNGSGATARFEDPYAVAVDSAGNTYVADATDHSIRKITPYGAVTTLAGLAGSFGSTDASGSAARFKGPLGIAVDSAGTVYVADTGNSTIRKITPAGVVTTFAGSAGNNGSADGTGTAARFSEPNGIAIDSAGNLYVADTSNNVIRKITAAGVVSTLAGSPGTNGLTNGTGSAARFSVPFDVAADSAGNVYVSDHGNHVVRKITAAGVVTTLAGSGSAGASDGTGTAASFRYPTGIAVDSSGTVFLADTDNHLIRKITAAGVVTSVGGSAGLIGSTDGAGSAARFFNPKDVTVDGAGNLYVADRGNHTVRKGSAGPVGAFNGLWWNESESGWGMSIAQHGQINFVAWYTYDQSGNPNWYVMSSCPLTNNTCTGDIYNVTGATALTLAWNGANKLVTKVGTGSLSFTDSNTASFSFTLNGTSSQKSITRQMFATGTSLPAIDYSDLWWNAAESGWGVAVTQQYAMIFATIFTYDALGNPVWYAASSCPVIGTGCTSDLYQVAGGSAPTLPWTGASRVVTKVGTVSFAFSDSSSGSMSYTINGVSGSRAITRQSF
ncbi:hypothetical protein BH11PSE11_BH11PSE11_18340 [soil metagenome]